MKKKALIIANSTYHDEKFASLPAAAADAEDLTRVLADPAIGKFAVRPVQNVTERDAKIEIQRFFSSAGPDDLLLLHLSLHGWKSMDNVLYFVASDTEWDLEEATAIPAEFVSNCMRRSLSRKIVLLLDCCYSGAFTTAMSRRSAESPRVDVSKPFDGRGRVVITASTSLQFAHERTPDVLLSRNQAQPSLFTAAIVRGLRDGAADFDGDGRISVIDLYDYVHKEVQQMVPGQTPTISNDNVQGTIYIVEGMPSPNAELLADMRSAAADPQAWKRIGALVLVGQALASVRESVRNAGRKALADLIADDDSQVARSARDLWNDRGLGPIPAGKTAHARLVDTEFIAGIDFGTTNSAIGILENGDVRMIPNAQGALTTPSIVAFTRDGQTLAGVPAQRQAVRNAEYTVSSVKLQLGTNWSVEHDGRRYYAEDVAALILKQLRADAEVYTGGRIGGAVITVPAYFSYAQRYALRRAAEMADINVLRITNEPTAASMTYGLNRAKERRVLVVDLGGGTFDVVLVDVGEGVVEVVATSGDNHLGGDDWDEALVDHLAELIQSEHGIDIRTDFEAMQRLRDAAETAKRELSSASSSHIEVPYLKVAPEGPIHVDQTLTRTEFENLTCDVLARCKDPIMHVLVDAEEMLAATEQRPARGAEETLSRIDDVLLVGGSTRMPAIGELLRQMTGKKPYRGLIPEGIATGAALLAGVLTRKHDEVLLIDVAPLSLGLETVNGEFLRMINRNTLIPTRRSEIFTTSRDNQDSMTIHVAEGEQESAHENSSLGVIEITGLSSAPKGTLQIEITFDIDANGVLQVSAKDLGSGRMMRHVTVTRDTIAEAIGHLQSDRWPVMAQDVPAPLYLIGEPAPARSECLAQDGSTSTSSAE